MCRAHAGGYRIPPRLVRVYIALRVTETPLAIIAVIGAIFAAPPATAVH